ncbi:hypothetical protein CAPTEDRAFT_224414 [Capitella teleta]|uniref:Uncharacterized protein n=1 Tax=Capitella teleta TaxID=283909 RepID=R7TVC0_CAPTE|nr:hypothetical protein CAPTEDRAFT_224414 [Capitella teleta]|eukprot:ELT97537.1 hypothetical protein CAPTEDRAFT_224414 [Capitella teleta]
MAVDNAVLIGIAAAAGIVAILLFVAIIILCRRCIASQKEYEDCRREQKQQKQPIDQLTNHRSVPVGKPVAVERAGVYSIDKAQPLGYYPLQDGGEDPLECRLRECENPQPKGPSTTNLEDWQDKMINMPERVVDGATVYIE